MTKRKQNGCGKLDCLALGSRCKAAFYPQVFTREGIELVVPTPEEQTYIHDKYLNELVHGIFLPETRTQLLSIVERMQQADGINSLILGGTELPLILTDQHHAGIPLLNTAKIHVEAAVTCLCLFTG